MGGKFRFFFYFDQEKGLKKFVIKECAYVKKCMTIYKSDWLEYLNLTGNTQNGHASLIMLYIGRSSSKF